jgi:hypothetical protein
MATSEMPEPGPVPDLAAAKPEAPAVAPAPTEAKVEAPTRSQLTFPDAPDQLIALWNRRRRPMAFGRGEGLPPPDVDLKPLMTARIPDDEPPPEGRLTLHGKKLREMRIELAGKPELAALNAILIAHLRKARQSRHAAALFNRIWQEEGEALAAELPGRWLISSIITFGDHGATEAQRRIGLAMNVFFSLIKLYEFERCHSRFGPGTPFPLRRPRGRRLPLGMPVFALVDGGLHINLLAQLWNEARSEPVAGKLACHLLEQLNADPSNLFRRIELMRAAKQRGKTPALPTDTADEAPSDPAGPEDGKT